MVTFDLSSDYQHKQYNIQPSEPQSLQYPAIRTPNITISNISIINIQPSATPSLQYPVIPSPKITISSHQQRNITISNNLHPQNYNIQPSATLKCYPIYHRTKNTIWTYQLDCHGSTVPPLLICGKITTADGQKMGGAGLVVKVILYNNKRSVHSWVYWQSRILQLIHSSVFD